MAKRSVRAALHIGKHDTILAAYPEYYSGPGWANRLVNVIVRDDTGRVRIEALQPSEITSEMAVLFSVCAAAHREMTQVVKGAANA